MHQRPTPAEILRNHLEIKRRTLPTFLRPQLVELIGMLDDWVLSVEQRMTILEGRQQRADKMPSPAALEMLTT
jgi:hypothetical protein